MRSGELFAGVGGLGMAVDEVFGSTPAWFAEFDAAPSKVLAHHFPDVPNYGDVTKIHNPPKVDILAGGFPCQDVSLAGRRRGMTNETRSGLWSEYARIIDETRPDWVVIENVRGLLSADAAVNLEPCPLCVGDNPEHVLRALGAVLGDLAELGFDAEWIGLRAADVGAPHGRFRVFILAWPSAHTRDTTGYGQRAREESWQGDTPSRMTLLPTPRTTDMNGPGLHGTGGADLRTVVSLMPTPRASRGGSATETMYNLGAVRVDDERAQGQVVLLPTPTVGNATGGNAQRGGDRSDEKLLPGLAVEAATGRLLPTPTASEGAKGGPNQAYGSGGATLSGTIPHLTEWGPYTNAIARWESVTVRPAPSPVRMDGKGGKARLNPELTEWMMGWPAGWVTSRDIGISRAEQLKACGNGVVPQQAAAALRELLARPGVPRIESK